VLVDSFLHLIIYELQNRMLETCDPELT